MKIWTAEAQSRHLVKNAKVSFIMGLFLLFNMLYDLSTAHESLSWLSSPLFWFGIVFALAAIIFLVGELLSVGSEDKAKIFSNYNDEYIRQLSLVANTWALNSLVAILVAIMLFDRLFEQYIKVEDVAILGLGVLLIVHSAKVLWEMREESEPVEEV